MKYNSIITNTFWGTVSSLAQNILYSLFFIIIARHYNAFDFGNYVIANALYGIILSFSSLGLGQWYMRNIGETEDKTALTNQFIKIQIQSGIGFYFLFIITTCILYGNSPSSILGYILGINIIFDNIISAIKSINIVNGEQRRTFSITFIEACSKLLLGISLFVYSIPIQQIVTMIVTLRLVTMVLLIRKASCEPIAIIQIISNIKNGRDWKEIILGNFSFVIIGSISILFWSLGDILASKFLSIEQVGYYEISFKMFAIAEIVPLMACTTIFPSLTKNNLEGGMATPSIYKSTMILLNGYSVLCYLFVYSYAGYIIPFLFGNKYNLASTYTTSMFLTMLIFPMSILQANLLVARKKEKIDMRFNLVSLIVHITISMIGLTYEKDLSIINYSIFISFSIFNILQTIAMKKMKWITIQESVQTYLSIIVPVFLFLFSENMLSKIILFPITVATYAWVYYNFYRKGTFKIAYRG